MTLSVARCAREYQSRAWNPYFQPSDLWPRFRRETGPQFRRHRHYAIAAVAVAKAEYEVNKKASENVPGSVSQIQLNELLLKCKEFELAIEKARLDQRIDGEEAKVAKAQLEKAKFPDDRQAQRELEVAEAEAKYNEARAKAEDDINVRYAKAAAEVAKAEYDFNKKRQATLLVRSPRHTSAGFRSSARRAIWPSRRPGTTSELPARRPRSPRPNLKQSSEKPLVNDPQSRERSSRLDP